MMYRNIGLGVALAIAWLICAAPSMYYNVLPHYLVAAASGWTDTGATGSTIFYGACVLIMTAVPQAIMLKEGLIYKVAFGGLGVALALLSWQNALDQTAHRQANETRGARSAIGSADAIDRQVRGLEAELNRIAPHKFVSGDAFRALQKAADDTARTRDAECATGLAYRCKERTTEATAARNKVTEVAEDAGLTEKQERLERELKDATKARRDLGAVPRSADVTAQSVSETFAFIGIDSEEKAEKARLKLSSAVVEVLPSLGLAILTTIILALFNAKAGGAFTSGTIVIDTTAVRRVRAPRTKQIAAKPMDDPFALPAPTEKPIRKPITRGNGGKASNSDSIIKWYKTCVAEREGARHQAGVFRESYEAFCEDAGFTPAGPKEFGTWIGNKLKELEGGKTTSGGKTYYIGIMPKLAMVRAVG